MDSGRSAIDGEIRPKATDFTFVNHIVSPDLKKLTCLSLCVYIRSYKEEGYQGDEDIFRAVFLRERTAEQFVRGV